MNKEELPCEPLDRASKKMKPSDVEEYDTLVGKLANMLNIAAHPDSAITIKAARLLIEKIISSNITSGDSTKEQTSSSSKVFHAPKGGDEIRIPESKFNLYDVTLPSVAKFDESSQSSTDDKKDDPGKTYDRAARSLKLLYLDDQKQLQLKVNEIISSIQSITANPKTDSKLLATGR